MEETENKSKPKRFTSLKNTVLTVQSQAKLANCFKIKLTPQQQIEKTIEILNLEKRNNAQSDQIYSYTNWFLKEFIDNNGGLWNYSQSCQQMFGISLKRGDILYDQTMNGSLFFIVLQGEITIFTDVKNNKGKVVIRDKIVETVKDHQYYRDQSLLLYDNQPYQTKAMAQQNTEIMCLDKHNFRKFFGLYQLSTNVQKFKILDKLDFFKDLDTNIKYEIYQQLFPYMDKKKCSRDEIIYQQKQKTENFYIVSSGLFEISQIIKKNGVSYNIRLFELSTYFGIEELFKNQDKRKYNVKCTSNSGEYFLVSKSNFQMIFHGFFSDNYDQIIQARLDTYEQRIENFIQHLTAKTTEQQIRQQIADKSNNQTSKHFIDIVTINKKNLPNSQEQQISDRFQFLKNQQQNESINFVEQIQPDLNNSMSSKHDISQISNIMNSNVTKNNFSSVTLTNSTPLLDRVIDSFHKQPKYRVVKKNPIIEAKSKQDQKNIGVQKYAQYQKQYFDQLSFQDAESNNYNFHIQNQNSIDKIDFKLDNRIYDDQQQSLVLKKILNKLYQYHDQKYYEQLNEQQNLIQPINLPAISKRFSQSQRNSKKY